MEILPCSQTDPCWFVGCWNARADTCIGIKERNTGTQENREEKGALVVVVCFHLKLEGIG